MAIVKTTRLKKNNDIYEIEIPEELVNKVQWRQGFVLEITEEKDRLIIEKLQGFMGA